MAGAEAVETFLFTFLGGRALSSEMAERDGLQLATEPPHLGGAPLPLLRRLFLRLVGGAGPGTRGPLSSAGGKREEQPQQANSSRRNFILGG